MPLPKAANLFDAVRQRGSITRMGDITVLRMDGAGAIATFTVNFTQVGRWAQSRPATGIPQKDRMLVLDRFELLFSRPGTPVQTRGSAKPLYELLLAMERIGMDIHDWSIPHAVEELYKESAKSQATKELDKKADEQEGGAEDDKADDDEQWDP